MTEFQLLSVLEVLRAIAGELNRHSELLEQNVAMHKEHAERNRQLCDLHTANERLVEERTKLEIAVTELRKKLVLRELEMLGAMHENNNRL